MNAGKIFEKEIKDSIDNAKIYYLRLPDPAVGFDGFSNSSARFAVQNDYDNLFFYKHHMFCIELKTSQSTSFSFETQEDIERKKEKKKSQGKNIKFHQIKGLQRASGYDGIYSGFIFNFRSFSNNTYFLDINSFLSFYNITEKKSINERDIVQLGGVFIDNAIKKIHHKYDMERLFDKLIGD